MRLDRFWSWLWMTFEQNSNSVDEFARDRHRQLVSLAEFLVWNGNYHDCWIIVFKNPDQWVDKTMLFFSFSGEWNSIIQFMLVIRMTEKNWQNAVRHRLSTSSQFVKVERQDFMGPTSPGSGRTAHFWTLDENGEHYVTESHSTCLFSVWGMSLSQLDPYP